jgi:hypothetical protein
VVGSAHRGLGNKEVTDGLGRGGLRCRSLRKTGRYELRAGELQGCSKLWAECGRRSWVGEAGLWGTGTGGVRA